MLERYDVIISEGAPDPMLPEVGGEWVKYADAQATIADLLKYRASLPAQGSAGKHACDLPGCVSCGNPPDAEGETRA